MASINEKILYSALSTLVMATVSSKTTYSIVEKLFEKDTLIKNECPTIFGHFLHTIIFFILIFVVMILFNNTKQSSKWLLAKYSFYGTLLYFVLTSSEMYGLVGTLTNGATADSFGCPTSQGIVLHAVVYFLMVFGIMFFPKDA